MNVTQVFQRRANGKVDFYRDWKWYKEGFGNFGADFWLGMSTQFVFVIVIEKLVKCFVLVKCLKFNVCH